MTAPLETEVPTVEVFISYARVDQPVVRWRAMLPHSATQAPLRTRPTLVSSARPQATTEILHSISRSSLRPDVHSAPQVLDRMVAVGPAAQAASRSAMGSHRSARPPDDKPMAIGGVSAQFTSMATTDPRRISSKKLRTPRQCQYSPSAVPRAGF
jgi:hypothetical protein